MIETGTGEDVAAEGFAGGNVDDGIKSNAVKVIVVSGPSVKVVPP